MADLCGGGVIKSKDVATIMNGLLIACADVGSIKKGNFGWADSDGAKGAKPSELAAKVSAALSESRPVALGFECPLYLPLPGDELNLGRCRDGEGSRPWSAGAGCAALATGLVQAAWTLREIRKPSVCTVGAYLDWGNFESAGSGLLLWEACNDPPFSAQVRPLKHTP